MSNSKLLLAKGINERIKNFHAVLVNLSVKTAIL